VTVSRFDAICENLVVVLADSKVKNQQRRRARNYWPTCAHR